MKKHDFEEIFKKLFDQPDIAWCVAIFRFLDANQNASIDSSDLFKIHNVVDHLKT